MQNTNVNKPKAKKIPKSCKIRHVQKRMRQYSQLQLRKWVNRSKFKDICPFAQSNQAVRFQGAIPHELLMNIVFLKIAQRAPRSHVRFLRLDIYLNIYPPKLVGIIPNYLKISDSNPTNKVSVNFQQFSKPIKMGKYLT